MMFLYMGNVFLTMANNEGKGWFAILLGGSISYKTELSDYILDAILFAKESFSKTLYPIFYLSALICMSMTMTN